MWRIGDKKINVHATGDVFTTIANVIKEAIKTLITIQLSKNSFTFKDMRKFALTVFCIENIELILLGAFKAPIDSIFYQPEDSPDWQLLKENLIINEIEDQAKFEKEFKKFTKMLFSTSATVFKVLERHD